MDDKADTIISEAIRWACAQHNDIVDRGAPTTMVTFLGALALAALTIRHFDGGDSVDHFVGMAGYMYDKTRKSVKERPTHRCGHA